MRNFALALAILLLPATTFADEIGFAIQLKLKNLGYDVGEADGVVGPKTRNAILEDSEKHSFPPTSEAFVSHYSSMAVVNSKPLSDESLIKTVKESVSKELRDPSSALFRNLRQLESGQICGEVNGKNGFGAYTGFQTFAAHVSKIADFWSVIPSLQLGPVFCLLDIELGKH